LLQETFVTATRAAAGYRGGSPRAWLFAIARSRFVDATRRRVPDPIAEVPDTPVMDTDPTEIDAVRRALTRLPERQRSALVLRDQLDLPYAEVAETLGISMGATKVLIHRARAAFRHAYDQESADA
jgi:RNA polymerase sigma factor (sigma-70 family)